MQSDKLYCLQKKLIIDHFLLKRIGEILEKSKIWKFMPAGHVLCVGIKLDPQLQNCIVGFVWYILNHTGLKGVQCSILLMDTPTSKQRLCGPSITMMLVFVVMHHHQNSTRAC